MGYLGRAFLIFHNAAQRNSFGFSLVQFSYFFLLLIHILLRVLDSLIIRNILASEIFKPFPYIVVLVDIFNHCAVIAPCCSKLCQMSWPNKAFGVLLRTKTSIEQ